MTNTSSRLSALGVLLAAFTAIPAAAGEPPGSPGKPDNAADKAEAKAEKKAKAEEKADAKAVKQAEKADVKAAKEAEKAEAKAEKAENKDEKSGPGTGPDGARGRGGFKALGYEFAKGSITKAELKERVAAMGANRNDRRRDHRVELKNRWGATLAHPACREELRHHARREAILNRALFLAQTEVAAKDKEKLIARIQKLIDKENERHEKAMERLKSMPAPAAAAPAPAAAAPPPATQPAAPAKEGAQ